MANIVRLGGGAAGGNELIVTAPTGSTVTATKDGKTKRATEKNGVFTFSGLEAGEWTVTATLGEQSASKVVTVVTKSLEVAFIYANFGDNSWSDIIKACQLGDVPSTWNVGDSKPMTINGASYIIDIIGKNHDTYTAGGTAPLTFQMHDCYNTKYNMKNTYDNNGGYDSTLMHTSHLPTIKGLMPAEVQAAVKPVDKLSSMGGGSSQIETISCNLFLLSEIEVCGRTQSSKPGEGKQYAYYSAGNSAIKKLSGTDVVWWTRSPYAYASSNFTRIYTDGTGVGADASNALNGVSFAFCF